MLFPTLSSESCIGIKKIEQYFKFFLQLTDLKIQTKELITRVYGDIAMNAGNCLISYTKGDQKQVIRVRFSFWYKKIEGEWKIIFHQSCREPKDN